MDRAALTDRLRRAGCVFAEEEADVLLASGGDLQLLVERRERGEPLEVVVGWADVAGVRVRTAPGVFVPRRRSELLVDIVTRRAPAGAVVLDLCCGTGAIGAAIRARRSDVTVVAADVDPAAVSCARTNLAGCDVFVSDLFDGVPVRPDVVVVNAPYVPTGELAFMPAEARDHEPVWTLDGGRDGLDIHRRIAAEAPAGCAVVIETSAAQAPVTRAIFEAAAFTVEIEQDDALDATAAVCQAAGLGMAGKSGWLLSRKPGKS